MAKPVQRSRDEPLSKPDRHSLSLSTYLEQITVLLVRAVDSASRRRLEEVVNTYFAPSLELSRHLDPRVGTVYASDRQSYIDGVLDHAAKYRFRIQPQNVTALLDEADGTAKVFITVTARGIAEARAVISNESVLIYHFERTSCQDNKDDEWLVVGLEFIRGPGSWYLMGS